MHRLAAPVPEVLALKRFVRLATIGGLALEMGIGCSSPTPSFEDVPAADVLYEEGLAELGADSESLRESALNLIGSANPIAQLAVPTLYKVDAIPTSIFINAGGRAARPNWYLNPPESKNKI